VLGLALQSTLGDVFSGLSLSIEKPYRIGDEILLEGGAGGEVIQMNWRSTHLKNGANDVVIVPNNAIAKMRIQNHSAGSRRCVRSHRSPILVWAGPDCSQLYCDFGGKILEHYQPWFFLYPTGQPVLESAEQLWEDLQATQRLFDPKGTAIASHHVVVIAHSMGGLLAHTLVSDSGDALWNVFADKPFNSLTLSPSEKNLLSGYFFFRHQPSIERVIFLAVPHRGSGLASGIVGSIASRLALSEITADQGGYKSHAQLPSAT
jgi:Mechanosensitive ion channel